MNALKCKPSAQHDSVCKHCTLVSLSGGHANSVQLLEEMKALKYKLSAQYANKIQLCTLPILVSLS